MAYSIAIDGPAGAGKSTIAKIVAKELEFTYVDTGAMFRAMAVFFNENNIDSSDENRISEAVSQISINLEYKNDIQQVILNNENITDRLRTEETGNTASKIAVYKAVRTKLLELQRDIAAANNVVMDGRDIGTCVLPNATLKIYLTASVETRAQRRFAELKEKGQSPDFEAIMVDIAERDYRDMNRETAPLKRADDAVLVDSSNMDIKEVADAIISHYNKVVSTKG